MEILLVESDRLVRDQVKVGLQQFPEFHVTWGEGYAAVNELRQRHFDCIFLGIDGRGPDNVRLLKHLRSFDRTTEAVIICSPRTAKDLGGEKSRMNITAFLATPVSANEFFKLVARLRARKQEATGAR
jgi:DNA-binding response OmpR family regulator